MKYFSSFAILLLTIVVISSCNIIDTRRIRGNGKIITKNYQFKGFDGIHAGGAVKVYLKQDSAYSIRVETDENLFNYLHVQVNNGNLEIRPQDDVNLDPTNQVNVYIHMPHVRDLDISGASEVKSEEKFIQNNNLNIDVSGASEGKLILRAPKITIDASGASTVNIEGETKDVYAEVSGASTINGYNLKSETADIQASGASSANVYASVNLKGDASGASAIRYKGNPTVNTSASGAGSVKKVE